MNPVSTLARLRLRKGMTQRELAAKADLTVETISRVENGRKRPAGFTIAKLAAALEMDFDELHDLLAADLEEASA